MTRREFLKTDEMSKVRKNLNGCAISGYIIAVLSFALNAFLFGEYITIVDSILLIILCLLIQLLQSRVASIILTIYAVFNMIMMSISYGRLAGWWAVVIGVYAIIYTFKFHKAWKEEKEIEQLRDGGLRNEDLM